MKNIILIIAAAFVLTSCFDEAGTEVLFSETFVELDAAGSASGSRTETFLRENIGAELPIAASINLASRPLSSAVNVTYSINPASTAVEGLHYRLNSNSVSIPAGSFTAALDIDVLPDNIEAGEQLSLIVQLTSADVDINTSLDSAAILLQISCPPNIPEGGTWTGTTTLGAFGVSGTRTNITIAAVAGSQTTYDISDPTANFYGNFGGTQEYPGRFENVCDAITLGTTTIGEFGTTVSTDAGNGAPAGTWNPATEVMNIPWYDPGNDFAENTELTRN